MRTKYKEVMIQENDDGMVVYDNEERELLVIKGDDIAVARYVDTTDEVKDIIVKLYCGLTDQVEEQATIDFLNFNDEEDEFCS